jgi:hypothetical protein
MAKSAEYYNHFSESGFVVTRGDSSWTSSLPRKNKRKFRIFEGKDGT